jgi:hypothetical protein
MTEAEFERRLAGAAEPADDGAGGGGWTAPPDAVEPAEAPEPVARAAAPATAAPTARNGRAARAKPAPKARRVQRMFAVEEELDRKLWLYAIHVGKDRSDVVNDLLRPLVGSMVLYDSRERRAGRSVDAEAEG